MCSDTRYRAEINRKFMARDNIRVISLANFIYLFNMFLKFLVAIYFLSFFIFIILLTNNSTTAINVNKIYISSYSPSIRHDSLILWRNYLIIHIAY